MKNKMFLTFLRRPLFLGCLSDACLRMSYGLVDRELWRKKKAPDWTKDQNYFNGHVSAHC